MNVMRLKYFVLKPGLSAAFMQLDGYASSGDFDVDRLRAIQSIAGVAKNRAVCYYLASLYLQLQEESSAYNLLSRFDSASREMKKFCCVLNFCRARKLPTPKLSKGEVDCLNYLQGALNPTDHTMEQIINEHGSFSVVGNAPGIHATRGSVSSCKFYFNDYKKNQRILDTATIHVVTPSWNIDSSENCKYLCITGNNIFYRRSRVWQKFIKHQRFVAIYTLPRALWTNLSATCGGSPSAGLLLLSSVSRSLEEGRIAAHTEGYVAGFSCGQTGLNHAYDSVPASARHNWIAEAAIYQQKIESLDHYCADFTSES